MSPLAFVYSYQPECYRQRREDRLIEKQQYGRRNRNCQGVIRHLANSPVHGCVNPLSCKALYRLSKKQESTQLVGPTDAERIYGRLATP
jgi:hypothetical protein